MSNNIFDRTRESYTDMMTAIHEWHDNFCLMLKAFCEENKCNKIDLIGIDGISIKYKLFGQTYLITGIEIDEKGECNVMCVSDRCEIPYPFHALVFETKIEIYRAIGKLMSH